MGFQVFPIDHSQNRFRPKASILQIDLSAVRNVDVIVCMINFLRPQWLHFGLPCGTCSRARERPVSWQLVAAGAPQPRPLRDGDNLLGKPGLTPHETSRVQLANQIYILAVHALFAAFSCGALVTLENPMRSWLWALLALLVKQMFPSEDDAFRQWYFNLEDVDFDMCMHGGERAKTTRLKASAKVFSALRQRCDGSHDHRPWTVQLHEGRWAFDTAAEAEYPKELASKLVQCVVQKLPADLLSQTYKRFRLDTLLSTGKQVKQHLQLVPEFKCFSFTRPPANVDYKEFPTFDPSSTGDDDEGQMDTVPDKAEGTKFGIYFSFNEHVDKALQLEHPANTSSTVPDVLRRNLFTLLTQGYTAVAKQRILALKRIMQLKVELAAEERELRAKMHPMVSAVTKGKPLVLWRKLLENSGFPDVDVVFDHMVNGVDLVGLEPESAIYGKKYKPLMSTPQQLEGHAMWRRKATLAKPATEEEKEQAPRLTEECEKEVELGFLSGPFHSEQQVSDALQTDQWTLNKRFLLLQGEEQKPRVIDNCRDSGVNESFGSSSYLSLHDTDFLAGYLRFIGATLSYKDEVVVTLSNGEVLRGAWHKEMISSPPFVGRCIDLSKAYKQVAVSAGSVHHAVLGHRTSDGGWQFHISRSLPFGASAAVFSFNKISKGIWHLLTHELGLLSCVYYDDYPIVEIEPLKTLTTSLVSAFLDVLGWLHATVGKKATPFAPVLTALGVNFSLQNLWQGELFLENKPERINRLERIFGEWKSAEEATRSQSASVHGMLNFACGFVLGNALKPLCKAVAALVESGSTKHSVREVCGLADALLPSIVPRRLECRRTGCRFLIYTDGAYEDGVATWGAII